MTSNKHDSTLLQPIINWKSQHDWPSLWSEYQEMKALDNSLSQNTFGKLKGIEKSVVTKHFKRIREAAPDTDTIKQPVGLAASVVGTVKAD